MRSRSANGGLPSLSELVGQAALLRDEVGMLRQALGVLSEPTLEVRLLPDRLSVKDCYGVLVELHDRFAFPALRGERPPEWDEAAIQPREADWNQRPIHEILDELDRSRQQLIEELTRHHPNVELARRVAATVVGLDLTIQRKIAALLFDAQAPGK